MNRLNPLFLTLLTLFPVLTTSLLFSELIEKKRDNQLISSHDNLYYYNQRNVINNQYRSSDKFNYYGPTYYRYNQIREERTEAPSYPYYYQENSQNKDKNP